MDTLCTKLSDHEELAGVRTALLRTLEATRTATAWLAGHMANPLDLLSGATPYLRLISTLTAGSLMAESAIIAKDAASELGVAAVAEKVASARFFCEQLMPAVDGLVAAATGDSELVMSSI